MNECKENDIQEPSVEQIVSNNNEKENPNISIHAQHNGLCTEESTLTDCEEDQVCDSSNTLSPKCPLQCRQNVISSNSLLLAPHNCVQEHAVWHAGHIKAERKDSGFIWKSGLLTLFLG